MLYFTKSGRKSKGTAPMKEDAKGPIVFVMSALILLSYIGIMVLAEVAVYTNQVLLWYMANLVFYTLQGFALLGTVALAGGITKEQYFSVVRLLPLL